MAKLTLTDVANLQNESTVVTALKSNNDVTEIAMEATLSRDGQAPNQMLSNLDMNNYKIINLPDALTAQEPATYSQLNAATGAIGSGAVLNADYVTLSNNATLLNERILTGSSNISITDGGPGTTATVAVSDNELKALATTTAAADKLPYFNGATTATTTDFTPYARTLVDDPDAVTARATLGSTIGTNVQAWDADLDAVAGLSSSGLIARTGAGTAASRTLQAPAAGFTITNPAGTAGDPTFVLANDLAAVEGMSGTGLAAHTASNTWTERTLTAPAAGMTITNPAGIAGNPTFVLANDLAAYEGLAANGLVARTATDTAAVRTITGPANGVSVTNGDGVAGNPTLALTNDLSALEALSTTGIARRTGTDTWTASNAVTNAELQNSTITIGSVATSLGGTLTAATGRGSTALNIDQLTPKGDTAYTILNTDRNVFTNAAFTAPRTWTLPAANTLNAGQSILIADLNGGVSSTNTLTISRAGADTINGATTVVLNSASTSVEVISDGTSKWYAVTSSAGGGGGSSFKAYEYTATAAQTTFSGADINGQTLGYTVNFVLVYVNGDLLNAADYTASSGTSVVFGTGRALNDQVKIVAMNQSATALLPANNLSDVASKGTAQTNLSIITPPTGRLTLQTLTPVMSTSQSAKTTIFYTPYTGNVIPIYDGTNMVTTAFTELSVATTDTTKSPAAIGASKVNDWFVWSDAGTLRVGHGPDWTNDTTRAAGTALVMVNGILLNNASITNGPAASRGTYVGTTRSNASSQLDWTLGLTTGGQAAFLNVWNMYNRRYVSTSASAGASNYNYTTATVRQAGGTADCQASFVSGLAEDHFSTVYSDLTTLTANVGSFIEIGIGLDSTTVRLKNGACANGVASTVQSNVVCSLAVNPQLGYHFVAGLELGDGTHANTFFGQTYASLIFSGMF